MSYASTEYRNLDDFYYLIGIGMPFMTSVSLTPWEIAVKQTGNMILSIRKEFFNRRCNYWPFYLPLYKSLS